MEYPITEKRIKYWESMKGKQGNGFKLGHVSYTPVQTEEHKRKKNISCSITSKGKHYSPKTEFKKGIVSWNKGKEMPTVTGDNNYQWKGDDVGYVSIHEWVSRWKGKPNVCSSCGSSSQERKYEWANIDHKYRRVLEDYIRMCTSCHRQYDKDRGIKIN